MSKETITAIAAGAFSGLLALSWVSGNPFGILLTYAAPLPLYWVGLSLGTRALLTSCLAGLAISVVALGPLPAMAYALVHVAPATMVVRFALLSQQDESDGSKVVWYPTGHVLVWLTLMTAAMLMVMSVFLLGSGIALSQEIEEMLTRLLSPLLAAGTEAEVKEWVTMVAAIFPGLVGTSWVIMVVANGAAAQAILTRTGRNLRPSPKMANLTVPSWAPVPLVVAAAFALVANGEFEYLGRNMVIVLAVPSFFVGLALVHALAPRFPQPLLILGVFYMLVVFVAWSMAVVAAIGFVEQLIGFRQRLAAPGQRTGE
ncbi:DUF2232 domain-containing protein [Magnetospira sp. QH-2]|uniref:DUF2232 domain-containing protein n=1 Tax=Magnetospira sp. (strain QH-2) TaxID=1288970 RepID=UPI0003E80DE2|nr:DUF2232 domain-containing protein [Magnetospira sp. QH-2]CCQ74430.1 conserved membrane protein of unknown function [Magnetospira sp. QH-2]